MQRISALLVLALLASSCNDPVAPPAPTPVEPTVTEQFSATLNVRGSNVHAFSVSRVGGLQVTLTSLTPGVTVIVGVGTLSGAVCADVQKVGAQAAATPVFSGTATFAGAFCVSVTDNGAMTEPAAYSLTVVHS